MKGTREPLGTLLPTGVALLFAAGLFGLPSCQRTGDGLLEADIRRTDRLVAERRFDVALEVLLELGQQNPDHALIARQLARVYDGLGRLEDEAAAWEDFLRRSPAFADTCVRLTEVYRLLDQPSKTIATAERCLSRDARQPAILAELARAHEALGNGLAADDAYRRAIDLDPTNPVLRVRLADRLVAGGKFAEAHTHAVEALRTSPGSLAAIRTLVAACEGEGDIAQAHTWIDQRLARAPDDQALKIVRARLTAAR